MSLFYLTFNAAMHGYQVCYSVRMQGLCLAPIRLCVHDVCDSLKAANLVYHWATPTKAKEQVKH